MYTGIFDILYIFDINIDKGNGTHSAENSNQKEGSVCVWSQNSVFLSTCSLCSNRNHQKNIEPVFVFMGLNMRTVIFTDVILRLKCVRMSVFVPVRA